MFCLQVVDWLNNKCEEFAQNILKPLLTLPGFLKLVLVIIIAFLGIIGLFRVAQKAFKIVVGVAVVFVILLVGWLLFFR